MKLTKRQLKDIIYETLQEGRWQDLLKKARGVYRKPVDVDKDLKKGEVSGTSYETAGGDGRDPEAELQKAKDRCLPVPRSHPKRDEWVKWRDSLPKNKDGYVCEPSKGGGGEKEPEAPGEEKTGGKDIPLSIFKKQKDQPALRSASGVVEIPLNAYIQKKLKLSAQAAQKIAKAIGANLSKAKGIPVTETLLREVIDEMARGATHYGEEGGLTSKAKKETYKKIDQLKQKMAAAEEALKAIDTSTSQGRAKAKNLEKKIAGARMDLDVHGGDIAKSKEVRATKKAAEKEDLAGKLKGQGLVGQIVLKYASRNKKTDPEFAQTLEKNPKIIKNINRMLRRQLGRRGYSDEEISKALSEILKRKD